MADAPPFDPHAPFEDIPHDVDPAKLAETAKLKEDIARAGAPHPRPDMMRTEEAMGPGGRFMTGIMDPVHGAHQLYTHLTGDDATVKKVDGEIQKREAEIRRRSGMGDSVDWWRTAGRAVPGTVAGLATLPLGGEGFAMDVAALGMPIGIADSLLSPVSKGNYIAQKTQDAMFGIAFGGFGAMGARGVGQIVAPTVREQARELMARGITLTPGQIAGGVFRRAEEAAKSMPILGHFIRGAEGRTLESFNRSSIDQALEPLGLKLPTVIDMGHDAMKYAKLRMDDAYENIITNTTLAMDRDLVSDMANIRFLASELPGEGAKQFDTILQNRMAKYFTDTGTIAGDRLKKMDSELNSLASSYKSSATSSERELGQRLDEVRHSIRDALARQNPTYARELNAADAAYSMFTRLQSAASRKASSQGVFTPGDLLQSIKGADRTIRKGNFATGDAIMQDFAEFADMVLSNRMADSGTPERALWAMIGASVASPALAMKYGAGTGAASLPYTKVGQRAVNAMASPSGPAAQAVGDTARRAAPLSAGVTSGIGEGVRSGRGKIDQPPPVEGAKQGQDGNYYVPDPNRPGKFLQVVQ